MNRVIWAFILSILFFVGCSVPANPPPLFPRSEQVFRPDLDPVVTQEKSRRSIQERMK